MYQITEEAFYERNLKLQELIADYQKKKEEYERIKSKETYFEMYESRNEICLFLNKIQANNEYRIETENLNLIFRSGELMGITHNILNTEYLITVSINNIQNTEREDLILKHAQTLQDSLTDFDKYIDELLELTNEIENTKQAKK